MSSENEVQQPDPPAQTSSARSSATLWAVALVLAFLLPLTTQAAPRGQLQIVAHEDDDLYFMTPAVPDGIAEGLPSWTVFLTAGDAGNGPGYWLSREAGIRAAYAQMAGVPNSWTTNPVLIQGRTLTAFRLAGVADVVVVFLRLPDGNPNGTGYASTGNQSLMNLWNGPLGTSIDSLDGTQQYTRSQLIDTLAAIVALREPEVLRIQDMTAYNGSDHSDHIHSGRFAFEAHLRHAPAHRLRAYRAYNIDTLPSNLSTLETAESSSIITTYGAFDPGVGANAWNAREVAFADLDRAHVALVAQGTSLGDVCLAVLDLGTANERLAFASCADDDRQVFRLTERDIRHAGRCLVSPAPGGAPTSLGLALCRDELAAGFTFFSDGHVRTQHGLCLTEIGGDPGLEACYAGSAIWEVSALPGAPAGSGSDFSLAEFGTDPSRYDSLEFGDIDGDGRDDACARRADAIWCALAQGDGTFAAATLWHPNFGDDDSWGPVQYGSTIQMGDLDGDGLADLCGRGIVGVYCVRSNGSAFFDFRTWTSTFSDADGGALPQTYGSLRLGDVNGDGLGDLCGHRGGGVHCVLGNGMNFASPVAWLGSSWVTTLAQPDPLQLGQTMMLGDLDGDGADDLCERGAAGVWCALASPGSSAFVDPALRSIGEYSNTLGWSGSEIYWGSLRLGDLTGDGQADLCGRGGAGLLCLVSIDGRFEVRNHLLSPEFSNLAGFDTVPAAVSLQLADIDGDGRADVCAAGPSALVCTIYGDPFEGAAPAINIDLGAAQGAPAETYGAAARLPGVWNLAGLGTTPLVDAAGDALGASVSVVADLDVGNVGGTATTDVERLLGDNVYSGPADPTWSVDLLSLPAGAYLVHLFAPSNTSVPTGRMRVAGIPLENVPGSAGSTLGRELSWRSVALVHPGGTLGIEGDANGLATYAGLAAIQLVPLPEPAAGAALGIGCGALFALAARRGRRPSPTPSRLRDSPSRPRRDSDTSCRRD
ncbi:MAG: FG-GAP-like repeat-containing protein [Myxococcota bacterium]